MFQSITSTISEPITHVAKQLHGLYCDQVERSEYQRLAKENRHNESGINQRLPYCSLCQPFHKTSNLLAIGNKPITTPCGHSFHNECLNGWMREASLRRDGLDEAGDRFTPIKCPKCRISLPFITVQRQHLTDFIHLLKDAEKQLSSFTLGELKWLLLMELKNSGSKAIPIDYNELSPEEAIKTKQAEKALKNFQTLIYESLPSAASEVLLTMPNNPSTPQAYTALFALLQYYVITQSFADFPKASDGFSAIATLNDDILTASKTLLTTTTQNSEGLLDLLNDTAELPKHTLNHLRNSNNPLLNQFNDTFKLVLSAFSTQMDKHLNLAEIYFKAFENVSPILAEIKTDKSSTNTNSKAQESTWYLFSQMKALNLIQHVMKTATAYQVTVSTLVNEETRIQVEPHLNSIKHHSEKIEQMVKDLKILREKAGKPGKAEQIKGFLQEQVDGITVALDKIKEII